MRVPSGVALSLSLALVAAGCRSEPHHSAGARESGRAISSAEGAGADTVTSPLLRKASNLRERASNVENDAIGDRNDAAAEKEKAQARAHHSELVKDQVGRQLADQRRIRDEEASRLDGLPSDGERTAARARLDARDAELSALEQEIRCAESEGQDARKTIESSDARLATAEERRKHAEALQGCAERYARAAEAERLSRKLDETRERLGSTPASGTGPSSETGPPETGPTPDRR